MHVVDFIVNRKDFRNCRFAVSGLPTESDLPPGAALFAVRRFAFTANNITYASFGDRLGYWSFFPAEAGYGIIPVWGFADVLIAGSSGLRPGERIFGYLPMASHAVLRPGRIGDGGFAEQSPHRAALPPAYNHYVRTAGDPGYVADRECQQALLRPLFMLSFLVDDFLAEQSLFGARSVLLSSASSKTALGLAFLLSRRRPRDCEVLGLTSPGNAEFVRSLRYYDRVIGYEDLAAVDRDTPAVLVDMAGSAAVLASVHWHFGEALKYSCLVGSTHWEQGGAAGALPGPKPIFFFAPDQMRKRTQEWGRESFGARFGVAWRGFLESTDGWLKLLERHGQDAVRTTYFEVLEGRSSPASGCLLSLMP